MTESREGVQVRVCAAAVPQTGLALALLAAGAGEKLARVAVTGTETQAVVFVSDSTTSVIGEPVHCQPLIGGQTVQVRLHLALAAGVRVAPANAQGGLWGVHATGRVVLETGGAAGELVLGRVAVTA